MYLLLQEMYFLKHRPFTKLWYLNVELALSHLHTSSYPKIAKAIDSALWAPPEHSCLDVAKNVAAKISLNMKDKSNYCEKESVIHSRTLKNYWMKHLMKRTFEF